MPSLHSLLLKGAGILVALSTVAAAQDYPTKPVRMIIPFPPGGSNDVVGRMIATQLSEKLGKQVVVDNRAGAGGTIGTELAANAAPDGYTLVIISIAHAVNPHLYKLNYDPMKSFVPVAILASGPNVLAINPTLPVNSVKELVALAKQKPGDLQWASAGIGSFQHLGGTLFALEAGIDILHVPFKGGGPAMIDVIGGHTKLMFSFAGADDAAHQAPASSRRWAWAARRAARSCPTCRPSRRRACRATRRSTGGASFAPAGTPPAIVEKLHQALTAVQDSPPMQKQFDREGAAVVRMSSPSSASSCKARWRSGAAWCRRGRSRRSASGRCMPAFLDSKDFWAGLMLVAIGVAAVLMARDISVRHHAAHGAGLFPDRARLLVALFGL